MNNKSWNLNAPQWANFNDSVRSDIDEYFNSEQDLETRYQSGIDSPNSRNSSYGTPRSNSFASPMLTRKSNRSTNSTNNSNPNSAKKIPTRRSMLPSLTTNEKSSNFDTLKNLNLTLNNKSRREDGNGKMEKINPAEDSCLSRIPNESQSSELDSTEENPEENKTLVASPEISETQRDPIASKKTIESVEPLKAIVPQSVKLVEKMKDLKMIEKKEPENVPDRSKPVLTEKRIIRGKPLKPTVLTSRVRHQSIERSRRPSGEFVSLAEKLSHFQYGTPERYRSLKTKGNKTGALQKVKQTTMKLTTAMSPLLRCKFRSRAVTSTEILVPQFRSRSASRLVNKSSSTNAKNLTRSKSCNPIKEKPDSRKTDKTVPSQSKLTMQPTKAPSSLSETIHSKKKSAIGSETMRKYTPRKKTVPTVVSTEAGTTIKDVEILHFGIPVGRDYKKITRPIPFSFETRTKDLNKSKKDKIDSEKNNSNKLTKPTFVARPAPSFTGHSKLKNILKTNENSSNETKQRTMSFKERNELAVKKKQDLLKKITESEKKARIFHAKPAPNFKPVFVRGNSTENLRQNDVNKKKINRGEIGGSNQENQPPNRNEYPKLKNSLMTQNLNIKKK